MTRHYGVTLSDLFCGRLSWRRLGVLVDGLPLDSLTSRANHGEIVDWSANEHLLAGVLDALNQIIWQLGNGKGARPRRITRPGQKPVALGRTDKPPATVRAYLDRFKPKAETDGT